MTRPVLHWLEADNLHVKAEFVTPWGSCDLVGLQFDPAMVARRISLKQSRPIGSITRAALLNMIPDATTGESTTFARLTSELGAALPSSKISDDAQRLIADRFITCDSFGRIQKNNGWTPLHQRFIAVELKVAKIEEVMKQALANLGFAEESYIGLPSDVAERVAAKAKSGRWFKYFHHGIGVLAVTPNSCRVVVQSRPDRKWINPAIQMYCADKFWVNRFKNMSA